MSYDWGMEMGVWLFDIFVCMDVALDFRVKGGTG
jgi:hypothetical protein